MSYIATVYNIMIASPGDVYKEREIAQKVISEWNYDNSESTEKVLFGLGWEQAVPDSGDRGQGIINRQILDKCDLLVGIFWTKLGTPTGVAESGSIEEIERHISKGKRAMLYFSSTAIPYESNPTEISRVKDFKQKCQTDPVFRSLYHDYQGLDEFEKSFRRHLTKVAHDLPRNHTTLKNSDENSATREKLISPLAKEILEKCAETGQIMKIDVGLYGGFIQSGNTNFMYGLDTQREIARVLGAFQELVDNNFVEQRDDRGEVFFVTNKGHEYVE